MKWLFGIILALALFILGLATGIQISAPKPIKERPRLAMELVGVTPHGHQIYAKTIDRSFTVVVLVRASDGYPIAIAK